jgi:hypothetical protein
MVEKAVMEEAMVEEAMMEEAMMEISRRGRDRDNLCIDALFCFVWRTSLFCIS